VKKVSFYVGEKQWQLLNKLAESDGRSTSELARQALTEFIQRYQPLPEVRQNPKSKRRGK